jgi:hypothetical protein
MNTPDLMQVLGFTEADLYANRSGRFSEEQKKRLVKEEGGARGNALGMGIFMTVIALVGPAIAVGVGMANGRENLAMTIGVAVGFGCLWPLMYGFVAYIFLSRLSVKAEPHVGKVEGPVNIVKVIRKSYNSASHSYTELSVYELRVGGHIFEVKAGLPNLMMQGDVYTVYFADFGSAHKPQVLSAEWLTKAGSVPQVQPEPLMADAEVLEYLKQGETLKAIREYRALHDSSYEEARSIVEEIRLQMAR